MTQRSASTTAKPYVLGRARFVAITAVEGLKLSPDSEARLQRTQSLSPEQRRAETIRAYSSRKA
jgi:hypothetical protein